MMLLEAIVGGKEVDIDRLIGREIQVCKTKSAREIHLCVNAGVEIVKGEQKGFPLVTS